MAIRVSKPEVNLRDKLNKAEPPIGAHGSQLLKSKSTSESFDLVRAGRRNLIINGDMRIWQRSNGADVSKDSSNGLKFGPDRWMFEHGCGQLVTTLSRSTDTPSDQGFKYSFQLSPTTVESALDSCDFAQYMYFVEGYDFAPAQWGTINAKPCTLSFWFKTNMGGEHYVSFNSSSGVDTWGTSIRSTMNVWEHHVITVPPPMTGTWNYTSGRGVEIRIGLMRSGTVIQANSGQWFHGGSGYDGFADAHSDWAFNTAHSAYLTGVQFEIGSQATPFEHRPYAEELTLCQRYFSIYHPTTQEWIYFEGSTNNHKWWQTYVPTGMRGEPSVTLKGTCDTNNISAGGGTISDLSVQAIDNGGNAGTAHPGSMGRVSYRVTYSGTFGNAYEVRHADGWGNGNGWIEYSAEI